MLAALAALLLSSQSAEPAKPPALGRTAWIVATIEHSEFCPAGNVRLSLRTGRYALVRRASRPVCHDAGLERPVVRDILDPKRLAAIRAAALRVVAEGFESPACRDGNPPEDITISNGGTPTLILTTGFATGSAIDDLSCWSDSATALHDLLDETFAPESR
ncbi:MAG TPA: hypothetical protein VE053_02095 [Allosphingosinicella sp.]|nr:hypothetical protein [Allosphingosinicella sp.]